MRLILPWVVGAVLITWGVWIVSNLRVGIGVSVISYSLALVVAFIMVLIAGFLWINVSIAAKH